LGGYFDLGARGKRRGFSPGADMGPVGLDQSKGGILKKSEKFCPRIFSGKKKMFFSRLISRVMEWNGIKWSGIHNYNAQLNFDTRLMSYTTKLIHN